MEITYSQLRREAGEVIDIGLEDCKAEMKTQLENKLTGSLSTFYDQLPDQLDDVRGVVQMKTSSFIVIKIELSGHMAILITENVPLTELARDRIETEANIEIGDQVYLNALLMDVT